MVTLSGSLVSIMTATIQLSVKTAIFINCSRGSLALSLPICSSKLLYDLSEMIPVEIGDQEIAALV